MAQRPISGELVMTILTFPRHTRPAQRIEARIEALRRHHAHMVGVNALLATDDIEGLRALGYDDQQIELFNIPDSLGCRGFSERTITEAEKKIRDLERGLTVIPVTEAPGWDGRP